MIFQHFFKGLRNNICTNTMEIKLSNSKKLVNNCILIFKYFLLEISQEHLVVLFCRGVQNQNKSFVNPPMIQNNLKLHIFYGLFWFLDYVIIN